MIPAHAHITKQFGNISVEVGWTEEPPLAGQLNSALIVVEKAVTGGNSTPVNNALSQLDIKEKYGGITKPIEFVPSEQTEGGYEAKIIPTRIGSYSLLMNGSIQNQNITNIEVPLDEVEGTQMFSFPDREISSSSGSVSGSSSGSVSGNSNGSNQTIAGGNNNVIGAKVEQILSQFSNDIDSIKGSIAKLDSNYVNIQNSIQNVKSASDISFIIGMAGVGAGISGVIISLIVLSRRGSVE
ncbi:MAG TPA: hypothetical protein VFY68_07435 [Nitrososphaeraceae archaeon]|nr:hypothetical protein [Nitrososphaeraceae archaeon]